MKIVNSDRVFVVYGESIMSSLGGSNNSDGQGSCKFYGFEYG